MNDRESFRIAYILTILVCLVHINKSSALIQNSSNTSTLGPADPKELEAFMDGVVSAEMKAHHIPGAPVAIVKDGKIIFMKGMDMLISINESP